MLMILHKIFFSFKKLAIPISEIQHLLFGNLLLFLRYEQDINYQAPWLSQTSSVLIVFIELR